MAKAPAQATVDVEPAQQVTGMAQGDEALIAEDQRLAAAGIRSETFDAHGNPVNPSVIYAHARRHRAVEMLTIRLFNQAVSAETQLILADGSLDDNAKVRLMSEALDTAQVNRWRFRLAAEAQTGCALCGQQFRNAGRYQTCLNCHAY